MIRKSCYNMKLDPIDYAILEVLNENGKISIKDLAAEVTKRLNLREPLSTTSAYHRFYKLRDANIIEHFSIEMDPDKSLFNERFLLFITTKREADPSLDLSLQYTLAKFLHDKYASILFSSVCEEFKIIIALCACKDMEEFKNLKNEIKKNPLIENIAYHKLNAMNKGDRLFYIKNEFKTETDKKSFFE